MKKQSNIFPGVSFFIIISLLALSSCNMEYFDFDKMSTDTKVNTRFAAPLVHGSVTIGDILNRFDDDDDVKFYDTDSLLYLTYTSSVFSKRIDEVISIPDQSYTENFVESDTDVPDEPFTSTETVKRKRYFVLSFNNDEKLDSIQLDDGFLDIHVSNQFIYHNGKLTVSSKNIVLGTGQTLNEDLDVDRDGGNSSRNIRLNEGTLIFDHFDTASTVSYLPITLTLELEGSSNSGPGDEYVVVNLDFEQLDYHGLFGYLGNYTSILDSNDNLEVEIFDDYPLSGNLRYRDPRFVLKTESSIGVPLEVNVFNVIAKYDTAADQNLTFSSSVNPFTVNGPDFPDGIGETKTKKININKNNCPKIVDIMEAQPKSIIYQATGSTNASGTTDNFALDSSKLKLGVTLELPLDVWTNEISLMDTMDFDFEAIYGPVTVRKLTIRLKNINGLPTDIKSQVYFADSTYSPIDSLFADDNWKDNMLVTKAAQVDDDGMVTVKTENTTDIIIDDMERIEKWESVKHIMSRVYCTTTGADSYPPDYNYVKFHVYDEVDIKVGIDAHLTVE